MSRTSLLKGLAILAFLIAALDCYSAFRHVGKADPGFLPMAKLTFMNLDKGFEIYDRILAADDRRLATNADLFAYVAALPPGTPVTYTIEHAGKPETMVKKTRIYGVVDLLPELLPSLLVGLLYLAVGTAAFWLKPSNGAARAHLLLTVSSGLAATVWVEWYADFWPHNLVQPVSESLVFLTAAALIHLGLVFPFRRKVLDRLPRLVAANYGAAATCVALAFYAWADNLAAGRGFDEGLQSAFGILMSVAAVISYLVGYGLLLNAVFRAPTVLARRQARVALLGGVVGTLPVLGLTMLAYIFGYRVPYSPWLFTLQMAAPVSFPLAIAYAIVRHKLFDIDLVIKRTVVYGAVLAMLGILYFAVLAGAGLLIATVGPAQASVPAGAGGGPGLGDILATATVAVGFAPLRDRTRAWVDARFFRSAYQFDKVVAEFGETLRQGAAAKVLLAPFLVTIGKTLHPEYLAALFRPEGADELVLVEAVGLSHLDGMVLPLDHPVIADVRVRNVPVAPAPAAFGPLSDALLIPLSVSGRLAGAILAGPRKSGLAYDEADRLLLGTLAQQFEKRLEQDELDRTDVESLRARTALSRYVSAQVADTVLQEHFDYSEGRKQVVTLLFSDIRGFTKLSEAMPPEEVVGLLNAYFTRMAAAVFEFDGMLDKFIGDGMMVVFGAPIPRQDHAWRAVQAALRMRAELAAFNAEREAAGKFTLKIGVGLHSGDVIVGNIGSDERLDFTAIGDTVNTASRIESLTKDHGADILMSAATYEHVRDLVKVRHIPGVAIRGKERALDLYALEAAAGRAAAPA